MHKTNCMQAVIDKMAEIEKTHNEEYMKQYEVIQKQIEKINAKN